MSDTLADMITRIRNGQKANKVSVKAIFSKLNASKNQDRKIYHMRGRDISGKNNLTYI